MEFIWDSEFDFAKPEFEKSFKELKVFLVADHVACEESDYHHFCESIINYYRANDTQKLYAILIGVFMQRMSLSCSMKDKNRKKELHNLATSALSTIPSSFLKDRDKFIHFVEEQLLNSMELSEIVQNIGLYLSS